MGEMIKRDFWAMVDCLSETDIAGWTLWEILVLCVGLLLLAGAAFIMIRANRRG